MSRESKFTRDDQEDLRLTQKAQSGNKKAFEKLVIKYQKRIYFTIRKMVLNHSNTNDIVQDTFVKAYLNLNKYDDSYPFYPWLHRIALNTAINFLNKQARHKESYLLDGEEEYHETFSSASNPEKEVEEKELKEHLYSALKQIPPEQRTVFILRTSEGLSYQEISEQLDISIGTVMSRLSRAREKLKELLEPVLNTD